MSFHVHCDVPGCTTTALAECDFYDHRCDVPNPHQKFHGEPGWDWLEPVGEDDENDGEHRHICPNHDPRFLQLVRGLGLLGEALQKLHGAETKKYGWNWQQRWEFERATKVLTEVCR